MKEIERKFLVNPALIPALPKEAAMLVQKQTQGYLSVIPPYVRVRMVTTSHPEDVPRAYLTVKSAGMVTREEVETEILPHVGFELLKLCPVILSKNRRDMGDGWLLDYIPALDLWIAEVELDHENQQFTRPAWVGREVTHLPNEYSALALAQKVRAKLHRGDVTVRDSTV